MFKKDIYINGFKLDTNLMESEDVDQFAVLFDLIALCWRQAGKIKLPRQLFFLQFFANRAFEFAEDRHYIVHLAAHPPNKRIAQVLQSIP